MASKFITAIAALTLPFLSANAATRIDDPVKFVQGVYEKLSTNKDYSAPDDIYSPRLAALFALDQKEAGGEVGRMDFDFWTDAQDFQLSNVSVKGQPVESAKDREIVVAKFKNLGTKEEIHFYFEKLNGSWRLDDVRSLKQSDAWTLSLILKYGWDQK
jgi:hypothetical protein